MTTVPGHLSSVISLIDHYYSDEPSNVVSTTLSSFDVRVGSLPYPSSESEVDENVWHGGRSPIDGRFPFRSLEATVKGSMVSFLQWPN